MKLSTIGYPPPADPVRSSAPSTSRTGCPVRNWTAPGAGPRSPRRSTPRHPLLCSATAGVTTGIAALGRAVARVVAAFLPISVDGDWTRRTLPRSARATTMRTGRNREETRRRRLRAFSTVSCARCGPRRDVAGGSLAGPDRCSSCRRRSPARECVDGPVRCVGGR